MFCFNSKFIKTNRPKRTETVPEETDLLWFLEAFFSNNNYSLWNQQATLLDFYFVKTLKSWMNTNQDNNNPCKILANSQQITAIHKFLYKSHNSKTNNSENLSWLKKIIKNSVPSQWTLQCCAIENQQGPVSRGCDSP